MMPTHPTNTSKDYAATQIHRNLLHIHRCPWARVERIMTLYVIIDRQTGLQVGQPYKSRSRASRRVDKLDNAYGAYRYYVKPIAKEVE